MDDANNLKAEGIKVLEKAVVKPGGGQDLHSVVQFMVGGHGPFTLEYPTPTPDPVKVKQDIINKVQSIKSIIQQ